MISPLSAIEEYWVGLGDVLTGVTCTESNGHTIRSYLLELLLPAECELEIYWWPAPLKKVV